MSGGRPWSYCPSTLKATRPFRGKSDSFHRPSISSDFEKHSMHPRPRTSEARVSRTSSTAALFQGHRSTAPSFSKFICAATWRMMTFPFVIRFDAPRHDFSSHAVAYSHCSSPQEMYPNFSKTKTENGEWPDSITLALRLYSASNTTNSSYLTGFNTKSKLIFFRLIFLRRPVENEDSEFALASCLR